MTIITNNKASNVRPDNLAGSTHINIRPLPSDPQSMGLLNVLQSAASHTIASSVKEPGRLSKDEENIGAKIFGSALAMYEFMEIVGKPTLTKLLTPTAGIYNKAYVNALNNLQKGVIHSVSKASHHEIAKSLQIPRVCRLSGF